MQAFELRKILQEQLAAAREAAANHNDHAYASNMSGAANTQRALTALESNNTILRMRDPQSGAILADSGVPQPERSGRRVLGAGYAKALHGFLMSGGKIADPMLTEHFDPIGGGFPLPTAGFSAALYEGSNTAGGYAVPVVVDDQIVPLAPSELAMRQLASVIPTSMDIKIPTKQSFSTATAKAETSAFTESEPTIGQITLSAYMAGVLQEISWELAQDVPAFQAFAVDDMILAQQMYEENLFVNGTGSGQAQGLLNNVGAGIFAEPDSNANAVSTVGILSLIGTLNEVYHANASFLMARPTSVVIRKAQMQSNLFFPAFTSVGGQDYLFGYPEIQRLHASGSAWQCSGHLRGFQARIHYRRPWRQRYQRQGPGPTACDTRLDPASRIPPC
ncbi:MAG: phage major capsid protein [Candidatus Sulfotelmatobacter sp.]